jgi:hypothetical protein
MIETVTTSNGKYTTKQILDDWMADFELVNAGNIRPVVIENVTKVRNCGNSDNLGFSTYTCAICGDQKKVAHTCKSRFCNSCGKVKNDEWIAKAEHTLFNVPHKHVVFTIPKELWPLFRANRPLLKILFKSSSRAILDWAATENFRPGIVTVMHTFGSDLKFNCHIHALYTMGGLDARTGNWRNREYLCAQAIKSRFKTILLACLRQTRNELVIPNEVKRIWLTKFGTANFFVVQNKLYKMNWYNWVGEKLDNAKFTTKYIGRYAKRPCLSEAKIKYYNRDEHIVIFEYKDKITKQWVQMEIDPIAFVGLLVQHIPNKYFHMIRYYGAYGGACRGKIFRFISQKLIALYGFANLLFGPQSKTWRERKFETTGIDPLKCQKCNITMSLTSVTYHTRDGTVKTVLLG